MVRIPISGRRDSNIFECLLVGIGVAGPGMGPPHRMSQCRRGQSRGVSLCGEDVAMNSGRS